MLVSSVSRLLEGPPLCSGRGGCGPDTGILNPRGICSLRRRVGVYSQMVQFGKSSKSLASAAQSGNRISCRIVCWGGECYWLCWLLDGHGSSGFLLGLLWSSQASSCIQGCARKDLCSPGYLSVSTQNRHTQTGSTARAKRCPIGRLGWTLQGGNTAEEWATFRSHGSSCSLWQILFCL